MIANVNFVVPAKDGCSDDKSLEDVVNYHKERLCILTSELDELILKLPSTEIRYGTVMYGTACRNATVS